MMPVDFLCWFDMYVLDSDNNISLLLQKTESTGRTYPQKEYGRYEGIGSTYRYVPSIRF